MLGFLTNSILNKVRGISLVSVFVVVNIFSNTLHAQIFFSDNFEDGSLNTSAQPKWSWKNPINPGNIKTTMMYAENDVYYVTNDIVNSGNYSLRTNLSGRNNWCNICGSQDVIVSQSDINAGCVSVSGGPWSDSIYNSTNGFSQWQVTSSTNSQVCFNKNSAIGDSMFGASSNSINSGDELKIPKVCGINGIVGGDIRRKSDCNKVINYFDGISAADIPYGGKISRRFYMYIPSSAVLPSSTLKLAYSHWKTQSGSLRSVKLKLSIQRGISLEINAPNNENIVDANAKVLRNQWTYFEETFVRETSEGSGDAEYHIYFGEDGENGIPHTSKYGFNLGALTDMSMHGNWQHTNDVSGYIYFDDIVIGDEYIGPISQKRPRAPTEIIVQ